MHPLKCAGLTLFCLVIAATVARAEPAPTFQFKKGQVLQYKVTQTTKAVEAKGDEKTEVSTQSEVRRRWEVLDVDAKGVATLQLSFTRLSMTQKRPDGKEVTYDSADPDKEGTDEGLKKSLSELLNKPMVVLRIASTGAVLEVKESKQGAASRYESELPFSITLPAEPLKADTTWKRGYTLVLDPPLGAGEKYESEQSFSVKSLEAGKATITFTTAIKQMPVSVEDRLPLLQFQPRGAVHFDTKEGLLLSATILSTGSVEGHQGEGSRYEFSMEYKEQLVRE